MIGQRHAPALLKISGAPADRCVGPKSREEAGVIGDQLLLRLSPASRILATMSYQIPSFANDWYRPTARFRAHANAGRCEEQWPAVFVALGSSALCARPTNIRRVLRANAG